MAGGRSPSCAFVGYVVATRGLRGQLRADNVGW